MGNNANQEGVKFDTLLERKYVKMPHPQLAPFDAQISASNLHRQRIAQSMREHGWKGLPLLVHNCKDGSYQAWMGMHRLLAASDAELTQIPVVLVTREQLYEAGFNNSEIDHDPWRFQARLARLKDSRPYRLMQLETQNQPKRGFP